MRVEFIKIDELSEGNVRFYTVRIGDNVLSEFELFDEKDFPEHLEEIRLVYNVIDDMSYRGAKLMFFKSEHAANALPRVSEELMNENKDDYGIRLYCIRLTDDLVILLNGDIKTAKKPLDCENVKVHFLLAKNIAMRLDKAIQNRDINYQDENPFEDYELEI